MRRVTATPSGYMSYLRIFPTHHLLLLCTQATRRSVADASRTVRGLQAKLREKEQSANQMPAHRPPSSIPTHAHPRPKRVLYTPSWQPVARQHASRRLPATYHGDRRRSHRQRHAPPTPAPTRDFADQSLVETTFDYENGDEVMFDMSHEGEAEPWQSDHETEGARFARHSPSSEEFSVQKLQASITHHAPAHHIQSGDRPGTDDLGVRPVYYQSAPVPKVATATTTAPPPPPKSTETASERSQHRHEAPSSSRSVIAKQSLDRIQHHIQQLQHIYKSRSSRVVADGNVDNEKERDAS